MTNVIDYDDQIFLPVFCNLSCTQYDVVFLDETQDFTKAQTALAMKMVKPDGIIIAVGDDWQSMYGFRGADVDSMNNVRTLMDADSLPLSITYRNPVCVVEAVNRKFPEINLEVAPWAKPGTITDMTPSRADVEYKPGDLVLCRCNAPLVKPAFSLIRRHIKAVILGRDIGSGLTTLVRKMRAGSIIDLVTKLTEYGNREVAKLLAADKNSAAEALHDRLETIVALSDGCTSVSEVEDNIEMVFSDKEEGVVFSSVHRAKGAEAERVFILSPELMPHPMAKQPWEREQERHIEYVAMTRTKETLVYVR
jgi:DNA helicase-2/ATP-dependent DNA helicase PcrA